MGIAEPIAGPDGLAGVPDSALTPALARDPAALEEFYRRHVRPLTRHVARRLVDPSHTDDIVAAAFLAAIESVRGYDPSRGDPGGWLFGIANNLLAAHRRHAMAHARVVSRLASLRPVPADEAGRVEDRLDAVRRIGPVTGLLDHLPPAERELVELVVTDDLTVPEAAARLRIKPGTARMRLARVRARLTRLLNGGH